MPPQVLMWLPQCKASLQVWHTESYIFGTLLAVECRRLYMGLLSRLEVAGKEVAPLQLPAQATALHANPIDDPR